MTEQSSIIKVINQLVAEGKINKDDFDKRLENIDEQDEIRKMASVLHSLTCYNLASDTWCNCKHDKEYQNIKNWQKDYNLSIKDIEGAILIYVEIVNKITSTLQTKDNFSDILRLLRSEIWIYNNSIECIGLIIMKHNKFNKDIQEELENAKMKEEKERFEENNQPNLTIDE